MKLTLNFPKNVPKSVFYILCAVFVTNALATWVVIKYFI